MHNLLRAAAVALVITLGACARADDPVTPTPPPPPPPPTEPDTVDPAPLPPLVTRQLGLELVGRDFASPVFLTAPAGDPRLFVVERAGRIRVVRDGATLPTPFLDIRQLVDDDAPERGMLSLAFHPRFATNRWAYVAYSANGGDLVVARYVVPAATPERADAGTELVILRIPHPDPNHYGGQLAFGPDGMLYLSVGDGSGDADSDHDAQSLESLLGKILRIDVDASTEAAPYAIPRTNPFTRRPGARHEVWALGLRNPWRMSFDAPSGKLYIADVGEREREEIDIVAASGTGYNFAWNAMEGTKCFGADPDCSRAGFTMPELEYTHAPPCTSVTGGFVYHGTRAPEHDGRYFFADFCLDWIRSIRVDGDRIAEYVDWTSDSEGGIQSFGVDGKGELYVLQANGAIYRIGPER